MWFVILAIGLFQTQDPVARAISVAPGEVLQATDAGRGPAVVLIPGLIGSAFGYRKVTPLLVTAGYRVLIIEPLGVGESSRPDGADYSLGAQALRVASVLDSLGVRDGIVVAHAVGGSIGLRLAYRRPDLVSGLVLLEGGPAESASTAGFRRAMKFAPLLKLFGGVGRIRSQLRDQLVRDSGDPSWVVPEVIEGYTAAAAKDLGAVLRGYRGMASAREADSITPHLASIGVPVELMIGGAPHGGSPDPAEIGRLSRALPDFVADTVPGVGHFPHEESPELVCRAVGRVRARVILAQPSPDPALEESLSRRVTDVRIRRIQAAGYRRQP